MHRRAAWCLLCACGGLWAASQSLLLVSLLTPDHWCREAQVDALALQLPLADDEVRQFAVPILPTGGYSRCERYSDDLVAAYIQWQRDHRPEARLQEAPVTSCDQGWHYNLTMIPSTIPSQNNWVCADHWKPAVIKVAYWLSAAAGGAMWMTIGNRYSKNFSLASSMAMCLLGAILVMICTTFSTLLIAWVIFGSCQMALMCLPVSTVKEGMSSKPQCTMHQMAIPLMMWQLSQILCLLILMGITPLLTSWWWLAALLPPYSILCLLISVWYTWTVCKKCSRKLHSPLKSQLRESSDDDAVLYDAHFQKLTIQRRGCSLECMPETDCKWKTDILFALHWLLCSWCYWMLMQTSPWLGTVSDAGEPSLSLTAKLILAELPSCCYPLLKLLLPNSVVFCRQNLYIMTVLLTLAPTMTAAACFVNWVLYKKALIQEVYIAAFGHFGAMSGLSMARLLCLSRAWQSPKSFLIWEPLGASLAAMVELIAGERDTKLLFLLAGIAAIIAAICSQLLPDYICCYNEMRKNAFLPMLVQRWKSSITDSTVAQIFLSEKTEIQNKCDSSLSYTPLEPG